jgi:hypothetical protein
MQQSCNYHALMHYNDSIAWMRLPTCWQAVSVLLICQGEALLTSTDWLTGCEYIYHTSTLSLTNDMLICWIASECSSSIELRSFWLKTLHTCWQKVSALILHWAQILLTKVIDGLSVGCKHIDPWLTLSPCSPINWYSLIACQLVDHLHRLRVLLTLLTGRGFHTLLELIDQVRCHCFMGYCVFYNRSILHLFVFPHASQEGPWSCKTCIS